jgi:hypothetical protein
MPRWLEEQDGGIVLVISDTWEGAHHRDVFRVVGSDGSTRLRASRHPDVIGLPVEHYHGPAGPEYSVRMAPGAPAIRVWIEHLATGPTEVTDCRRAGHPRRKCPQCAAERAAYQYERQPA